MQIDLQLRKRVSEEGGAVSKWNKMGEVTRAWEDTSANQ